MKLYSNNDPKTHLEFVSLIYFVLLIFATSKVILSGDNSYFWKAHFVFIGAFLIILFSTNILRILIAESIGNWGGVCLLCFLSYYLVMSLGYQDIVVSSNHIRYITRAVIPGLLTGFVLFSKIGIRKVHGLPKLNQSIRVLLLNTTLIASLLICLMVILFILSVFWSIRRTDIFLITNITEGESLDYQAFGMYALLMFIGALRILHYYLKQKKDYYILFCSIIIFLGAAFIIALALVGSNKELVVLILILIACIIYSKPKDYVIKHCSVRPRKLIIVLSILLLLCISAASFYILDIEMPYLRIFGFQEQTSLWENRGLASRIEIFTGKGIDQLFLNPLFGNLGAEHVVGGTYIHSLISVQSHLGMIGTFLILGYLIHRLYRLYANDGRSVLKMITPPILFISFIGTFFTWFVFWFIIGSIFAPRKDL